jgi:WD40 repeat protein
MERLSFLGTNVLGAAFSADGRWLAVAESTGNLRVWDWSSRQVITNLVIPLAEWVHVLFSARSTYLFATTPNRPRAWKTAKWEELPNSPDFLRLGIVCTGIAPNERQWASGHRDGMIRLWTFPANEQLAEFSPHLGDVIDLAFSPDGHVLACASNDGYVNLYDVTARRTIARLRAHFNSAQSVCFSPDGRRLTTLGTHGDFAKLWGLATLRPLVTLPGSGVSYFHAAFSPDGSTLVGLDRYGGVDLGHAPTFAELEAAERSHAPPGPQP